MLLPSDVARLVLGYLQQEGLSATSRAFICESPNLQEYAEHSSEDGIIPACMFSLFGKNLITILNEYVAVKSKETSQENQIPVVMASLWKKLDFTLNQIKSMQNSPALQMNQRLRTKHHIQSMTHQPRPISASQSPGHLPVASSVTSQCVPSPLPTPQGMLGHSTPVSYTSQYSRPSTLCLTQIGESPLQILVPDHRLNPGPLSPARRKCDSPRRRGGGQMGASGTCRSAVVSSAVIVETANEESVAENLSQKVIENAREKILNDRSLQEKLAENINKILASDNSPQTSKVACSTIEQEQSIDEILGLQGEIHMTDDAIQDILAQTESDPAFQALFDLFDYGKSKSGVGGEEAEESFTISVHESDETGHIDSASETGITQEDPGVCSESARNLSLSSSESKNKKKSPVIPKMSKSSSTALQPRLSKQTGTARGSTHLKKGLVRSRVLSDNKQTTVCTKLNNKTDCCPPHLTESSSCFTEEIVVMETDDPQDNTSENVPSLVPQGSSVITINQCDQLNQVSNKPHPASIAEASGEQTGNNLDMTRTSMCAIQSQTVPSVYLSEPDVDVSILTPQSSNKTSPTSTFTQHTDLTQPCCLSSIPSAAASPSLVSSAITSDTSTSLHGQTKEPDPSKILSLKIILSDEQDGQLSDVALNQAVSSITSDRIPTIFLSSPAKSPAKTLSTVITHEETAQAVNILQGMEGVGSFGTPKRNILSNAQATVARPVGQETGFIQLLPANTSYGSPASYFVVTDPASTEQRSNIVLLPKSLSQGTGTSTPHVIATPPRQRTVVSLGPNVSQTYTPGSTIIISSPVQPMLQNVMLPLSVVGQNTGKLTVVPNQMLSLPCPTAVRQPVKVVSQPNVVLREKTDMGKTVSSGPVQVSKILSQNSQISDQPSSGTSPSHRRILHFDTTSDNSTAGQNSSNLPSPLTQKNKDKQTEPKQPTVSDTSKRRIEPIRVPEEKSNVPSQTTEAHKKRSDQTAVSGRTLNKTANESQVRDDGGKASQSAKSAQDQKQKPASTTKTPEEQSDERPKPADKISSQYTPCVTANKENELEGCQQEQRLPENLQSSMVKPPIPVSISSAKILCKTSPLTKQAVEMLHDIKGQTPPRKQHNSISSDLPRTSGAGLTQEEVTEGLRTPVRHRHGREGESTPRCLPPPVTPDVPSCSPASEAGSENSINMAAHTLMILSRAARTGGPLKDSLRQEEVSPGKCSVPKAKKRKHIEPSPQAKKELQLSGSSSSKKKSKKQKKLLDSFPDDLDVDKFLSSLHYDE